VKTTFETVSRSLEKIAVMRKRHPTLEEMLQRIDGVEVLEASQHVGEGKEAPLRLPYSSDPVVLTEVWK